MTGQSSESRPRQAPFPVGLVRSMFRPTDTTHSVLSATNTTDPPPPYEEDQPESHNTVSRHSLKKMVREWDEKRSLLFSHWPTICWMGHPKKTSRCNRCGLLPAPGRNFLIDIPRGGLALEAGEHVFSPHNDARWPQSWGWCIQWKLMSGPPYYTDSAWGMDIHIITKLPPWQQAGVSFSDSHMSQLYGDTRRHEDPDTNRGWNWGRTYAYTSKEAKLQVDRAWMAEVYIAHSNRAELEALDWRSQLTAQKTAFFKIDQKVGPNEYKNVVLYQREMNCGNDITGQKMKVWDEDAMEQLAKFASSIMTLG